MFIEVYRCSSRLPLVRIPRVYRGLSRFIEVHRGLSRFIQVAPSKDSKGLSRFIEVHRGSSRFFEVVSSKDSKAKLSGWGQHMCGGGARRHTCVCLHAAQEEDVYAAQEEDAGGQDEDASSRFTGAPSLMNRISPSFW